MSSGRRHGTANQCLGGFGAIVGSHDGKGVRVEGPFRNPRGQARSRFERVKADGSQAFREVHDEPFQAGMVGKPDPASVERRPTQVEQPGPPGWRIREAAQLNNHLKNPRTFLNYEAEHRLQASPIAQTDNLPPSGSMPTPMN